MNKWIFSWSAFLLLSATCQGQARFSEFETPAIETQPSELPSVLVAPDDPKVSRELPEAPRPKTDVQSSQENTPCPSGTGRPCALLGGRLYFRDIPRFGEHDRTWWDAMRHPAMLIASGMLIAAVVADTETTAHCLKARTCTEGNPLFGKRPSRGLMYGVDIPLLAGTLWMAGDLKRGGKGTLAMTILYTLAVWRGATAIHNNMINNPAQPPK